MKKFSKILPQIKRLFNPKFKLLFLDDLPEKLFDRTIYIIGTLEEPWLLAFYCPCGCKKIIKLNLIKGTYPRWNFKVSKGKINIVPSVWGISGCKSHFVIRKSKVIWMKTNKSQISDTSSEQFQRRSNEITVKGKDA